MLVKVREGTPANSRVHSSGFGQGRRLSTTISSTRRRHKHEITFPFRVVAAKILDSGEASDDCRIACVVFQASV